jgi:hypothetical protein
MKLGTLVSVLFSIGTVPAGGRKELVHRREETKTAARYLFVESETS